MLKWKDDICCIKFSKSELIWTSVSHMCKTWI